MPLDLEWIRRQSPGHQIHWFDSLPTTMTEAARLAAAGCPSGTVVGADEQTAGRGRMGRSWHSASELGLYVSIVLRLPFPAEAFPALTLAMGLAAREAIASSTGIECDLRWPNDLLIAGRKCTGILVTLEPGAAIAGIGINVNHDSFPPGLASTATSLRLDAGRPLNRETILLHLLEAVDRWCGLIASQGIAAVVGEFSLRSSYTRGKRVIADAGLAGTTVGLDEQGFLLLRRDNGEVTKVLAGGVRPA